METRTNRVFADDGDFVRMGDDASASEFAQYVLEMDLPHANRLQLLNAINPFGHQQRLKQQLASSTMPANQNAVDLDSYKARVRDVALRYGRTHDWCSVVEECLRELDIEPFPPKLSARVQVTYELSADIQFDSLTSARENPEDFLRRCIMIPDLVMREGSALSFADDATGIAPSRVTVRRALVQETAGVLTHETDDEDEL